MRFNPICALWMVACALPVSAQEAVTLEWKFKKGDVVRFESSHRSTMEVAGTEMIHDMLFGTIFEVTNVTAEGVASIKATYDRLRVKIEGPMSADYDSEKGPKAEDRDLMGRIFSSFLGKSIHLQVGRAGRCLKLEGTSRLLEAAIKGLPEEMQGMAGMMKASMNDEYSRALMQMNFGFLPKAAVSEGESWTESASLSMGALGRTDMKMKSTLREIRESGKEAAIDQEATFEFKGDDGGGPMGPMEVTKCTLKAEMIWLVKRGLMKSTHGQMTMEVTMGGQEMTSVMKTKMCQSPKGGSVDDPKRPQEEPRRR